MGITRELFNKRYIQLKKKTNDAKILQDIKDISLLVDMMFYTFNIQVIPENRVDIEVLIADSRNTLTKHDLLGLKSMTDNICRFKNYEENI